MRKLAPNVMLVLLLPPAVTRSTLRGPECATFFPPLKIDGAIAQLQDQYQRYKMLEVRTLFPADDGCREKERWPRAPCPLESSGAPGSLHEGLCRWRHEDLVIFLYRGCSSSRNLERAEQHRYRPLAVVLGRALDQSPVPRRGAILSVIPALLSLSLQSRLHQRRVKLTTKLPDIKKALEMVDVRNPSALPFIFHVERCTAFGPPPSSTDA